MKPGLQDSNPAPVTVVDYGVGNIAAILNMLEFIGVEAQASSDASAIADAAKLMLPGVGAFDKAMGTLAGRGLVEPLNHAVLQRRAPVLGVCLGMQLLARRSEEGVLPGLGWVRADVRRIALPAGSRLKVPHIGWADVAPTGSLAGPFDPAQDTPRFYFDHSYHMACDDPQDVAGVIDYGGPVCCAVTSGNIWGVQFHPEKSHRFGMQLLRRFGELPCASA